MLASLEWVNVARVAVTVTHFPEERTLAGNEEEQEESLSRSRPEAAGYDPALLLPFCVQANPPQIPPET